MTFQIWLEPYGSHQDDSCPGFEIPAGTGVWVKNWEDTMFQMEVTAQARLSGRTHWEEWSMEHCAWPLDKGHKLTSNWRSGWRCWTLPRDSKWDLKGEWGHSRQMERDMMESKRSVSAWFRPKERPKRKGTTAGEVMSHQSWGGVNRRYWESKGK